MRTYRFVILFAVALATFGLIAYASADQTAHAQGNNLLQNPSFEAGVYTFDPDDYSWLALYSSQREDCKTTDGQYLPCNTAQVPTGWIPWWISQSAGDPDWKNRMPEYKPAIPPFNNRIHSGNMAAQYFTFHGTHTAGLLQVVDVPANAQLRFSIFGQAWSNAGDELASSFPTPVNMRIGIDPTGTTNPYSPAIVWSDYKQPYDAFQQFVVEAQAQGSKVTVFTISSPDEARKHNDIYWDDAELVVLGQGAAPPPPAPTTSGSSSGSTGSTGATTAGSSGAPVVSAAPAAAGPTATPDADGVIYAEVQAGDSFWSIAARNGLTIDEIYELNDASEGDFVQVGERLIVGYAEPPESEEAAAEETAVAEEAEAEATPTRVPPTPTATPAGGEICLRAFVDDNQNARFDSGEALKSAVAFTIYDGESVVSNYVTDGLSEPYCITGLDAGTYRITRSTAPGEVLTTAGEAELAVEKGSSQIANFGSYQGEAVAETGSLAGADGGETVAASVDSSDLSAQADLQQTETDNADGEGGITRWVVIAAVVIAVLLLVGVLVVILSARRSTV